MTRAERWTIRVSAWLGLWLAFLLGSPVAAQTAHSPQRVIAWSPPPLIGMYTVDSARINDLAELASADWPTMWVEDLAKMRACSGLYADLRDWSVWTVSAPAFYVRYYDRDDRTWIEDHPFVGFAFPHVRRIYVVQAHLSNRLLLQHEMLHALLAERGFDPRHNTNVADAMFKRCFPKG